MGWQPLARWGANQAMSTGGTPARPVWAHPGVVHFSKDPCHSLPRHGYDSELNHESTQKRLFFLESWVDLNKKVSHESIWFDSQGSRLSHELIWINTWGSAWVMSWFWINSLESYLSHELNRFKSPILFESRVNSNQFLPEDTSVKSKKAHTKRHFSWKPKKVQPS